MKNRHRKEGLFASFIACLMLLTGVASAQVEKGRTWTNVNGKKVFAVLRTVAGEEVVLSVSGKEVRVKRDQLGEDDQKYLAGFAKRQTFGKIEVMELKAPSDQERWMTEHRMHSFVWTGKGLALPFLLHVPELKVGEKAPLVVFLHGLAGIGHDNLKPLFFESGGIAQIFMDPKFQNYRACYVLIS